ncbi:MAG: hypothetical protein AAGC55_26440 [Myxococcota bacterium]
MIARGGLLSLDNAAPHYQPSDELLDTINVALAVGAPLLLTGKPGTGKTLVAHYLAWYFEVNAIDQHKFYVRELKRWIHCGERPPIIVSTSNNERRLPEPFVRRCVFHRIRFDEALVRRAVQARSADFPISTRGCSIARSPRAWSYAAVIATSCWPRPSS